MIIGLIITGCIVLLTYYFAVVLKELAERLKETEDVISNVDDITENLLESQHRINRAVESIEHIAVEVEESFNVIRTQLLVPATYITTFIQKLQEYFGPRKESSQD